MKIATNVILGFVGAVILTGYLVGFVGEHLFKKISKEDR